MRLSKRPLYLLYIIDSLVIFSFLFVHFVLLSWIGDEIQVLETRNILFWCGFICIVFTLIFRDFFGDLQAEFKMLESRIFELEKKLDDK